jgi:hypothetical protein
MPNVYEAFETSKKLEQDGIVLDYGSFKFTIARAGGANRKFANLLDRKLRPHRRAIQAGVFDDETAQRLLAESYAEAVVLGWEGVTDRDGNPLPFNRENCVRLLTDLPSLFEDVREQAQNASNFLAADREQAGKA